MSERDRGVDFANVAEGASLLAVLMVESPAVVLLGIAIMGGAEFYKRTKKKGK
jgi:hypothetical protein